MKYIASTEEYKGFRLDVEMETHESSRYNQIFHRSCRVYKDGEDIAVCKSKKEAKDLIDHNCF